MTSSLSTYWVKFFKFAGFPQDVATKHALVFSNNRIQPDMLPDLDKPSLKEMGITLMGDMIAILRYAKKVVEETTCKRFLVDSEDSAPTVSTAKPVVKKVASKSSTKTSVSTKVKPESTNSVKSVKVSSASAVKAVAVKKVMPATKGSTIPSTKKRQVSVKRKIVGDEESSNDCDNDDWSPAANKKLKTSSESKDDNKVGYTIILPKGSTTRSQQILKKSIEQKRTVFDRLGDSSVTSTTNSPESPTFNVTGLGKDVYKRSVSVFNRLGDKDTKKDIPHTGILKNGTSNSTSQGILKNRSPNTSSIVMKKVVTKPAATMRADLEDMKNFNRVKRIGTTMKKLVDDASPSSTKVIKLGVTSGKLASERLTSVPAKARLGIAKSSNTKQVTFNRVATVTHVKKPDVFSRLGI